MDITLIKLGGSLITDKSISYTSKPNTIRRLAKEIRRALDKNPNLHLVLGNGAGSFAHTSASKYGTAQGYSDQSGKQGFCIVQHDASFLNQLCTKIFLEEKIPVISVSPNNIFLSSNNSTSSFYDKNIQIMLEKGIIPFLYGDAIIDTDTGSCIYSCDQIMEKIADSLAGKKFRIVKIISVGDFPGVMDSQGSLITTLNPATYKHLLKSKAIKEPVYTDVTGGMKAKIETLMKEAMGGRSCLILDGRKKYNLYHALIGSSFVGTKVES